MLVYSKKIIRFANEIKITIKEILSREVGLKVFGDRFYDRYQTASYSISVVIFNDRKMLGYFDAAFYELGFHTCLMYSSKKQLHDIIRHELAHYITFINFGLGVQAHGGEFRACCQQMGWGEEVYLATTCLDDGQNVSEIGENDVLRKVKKLMALATSSNQHEAEQAMIKSQQLLMKQNIDAQYLEQETEEKIFLKRIMKQKKKDAKMSAIAKILETFFVSAIYNRAGGYIYLEIIGSAVNVEIAEHVAGVLDHELDRLWNHARKLHPHLSGMVAKNSFFYGIAVGYCNKIQALKREYPATIANALVVIESKIEEAKAMVYPRLTSSRSNRSHCSNSAAVGEQMGKHLNIHTAVHSSSSSNRASLVHLAQG